MDKEYYQRELKDIYNKTENVIRELYYLEDFEECSEDFLELVERTIDKLYEAESEMGKALKYKGR